MSTKRFKIEKNNFDNVKQFDAANIWYFFKLLFIRYIKSPVTYLSLTIPLIMIVGLAGMLNTDVTYMAVIATSLVAHVFISYGTAYYSLRKSTLNRNLMNSGINRTGIYLVVGLFSFVTSLIFAYLSMALLIILVSIPGLFNASPLDKEKPIGVFNFMSGHWGTFIYYSIVSSALAIAIAFLFQAITSGIKGFMAVSMAYVILMVLFGAVVSHDFADLEMLSSLSSDGTGSISAAEYIVFELMPRYGGTGLFEQFDANGNLLIEETADAFMNGTRVLDGILDSTQIWNGFDPESGEAIFNQNVTWEGTWWLRFEDGTNNGGHAFIGPESAEYIQMRASGEVFDIDNFTYWVGVFIPHFWINSLGQGSLMSFTENMQTGIQFIGDNIWNMDIQAIGTIDIDVKFFHGANPEWLLVHVMPYIYIVAFSAIGAGISYMKTKRGAHV